MGCSKLGRVELERPLDAGYIHLAAKIDRRNPVFGGSRLRRHLEARSRQACQIMLRQAGVVKADVYSATMYPPGYGRGYTPLRESVEHARFDLVILVQLADPESARALRESRFFRAIENEIRTSASHVHIITAKDVRRIGEVDRTRPGLFHFNYFAATSLESNLDTFERTASWFTRHSRLDNSELLCPIDPDESDYTTINFTRWDRYRHILLPLLTRPSFRTRVLKCFRDNEILVMPVFYRQVG